MKHFSRSTHIRSQLLKRFLRFFILSSIAILFPAITTMCITGRKATQIYTGVESGRLIVFDDSSHYETMDMEDFLPLAVLGQLSVDAEPELLKSFTIIMRTYIISRMGNSSKISINELNIPYTSYPALEDLWGEYFPENYKKITELTAETSMLIMTHNGEAITPFYHSISSGKTRSGAENLGESFSYLSSVTCPSDSESDIFEKTYTFTNAEFASQIRTINPDISISSDAPLENIQITSRDSAGYIIMLEIGGIEVNGQNFCDALNINSPYFLLDESDDGVSITTYGQGHGYGLSLNYASSLANGGAKYKEILNYFFNQIKIKAF